MPRPTRSEHHDGVDCRQQLGAWAARELHDMVTLAGRGRFPYRRCGRSGRSPVVVDESAEAIDSFDRSGQIDNRDHWDWRAQAASSMGTGLTEIFSQLDHYSLQVASTTSMSVQSRDLAPGRSAYGFAFGKPTGVLIAVVPSAAKTVSNASTNFETARRLAKP
jgi:hypothetical protein